jgi:hypothetical protein
VTIIAGLIVEASAAQVPLDRPVRPSRPLVIPVLTVINPGLGSGVVTSTPAGITCGTTCAASLPPGTVVTLSATANGGSVFAGWGFPCAGTGTCTFTLNADTSVVSTFNQVATGQFALTVTKSGTGIGNVISSPSGIDCGGTCTFNFPTNSVVTLTPAPLSGSVFAGWGGSCSGTANCSLTMNAAKTAAATFNASAATSLTINTPALFDAEMGFQYSFTLAASGGPAPYTWSLSSGALPAGFALSPTGVLSGLALGPAGQSTFTVQVRDAANATATKTYTWKIKAPANYVLPQSLVDTSLPSTTGGQFLVTAGGDLQSAINGVPCGSTILLQAGATFAGQFYLPEKNCNGNWVTIRTQTPDGTFPNPGTRVTPQNASMMPKIVASTQNVAAIRATQLTAGGNGGSYYRLIGLEITVDPTKATAANPFTSSLLELGLTETSFLVQPHHIIVDRCYIHGTPTTHLRRGISLNGATMAIVDSNISEIHQLGSDSQGILGTNGPGPFKIENNRIEAATENLMFGGAKGSIGDNVPSDIEIKRNYFFKPLSWRQGDPSYQGTLWQVKNILELKNARRVLIEGNVFENSWPQAQVGFGLVLTPRAGTQGGPSTTVSDITIRKNIIMNVGSGINILSIDNEESATPPLRLFRVLIKDNLFLNITTANGDGRLLNLLAGPPDVTFDHNTAFQPAAAVFGSKSAQTTPTNLPIAPFTMTNNLLTHGNVGIFCSGFGIGNSSLNNCYTPPTPIVSNNVLQGGSAGSYPGSNQNCGTASCFPASTSGFGLVDFANCNSGSMNPSRCALAAGSPYKNAGTDGKDLGADISAVVAATAGVRQ